MLFTKVTRLDPLENGNAEGVFYPSDSPKGSLTVRPLRRVRTSPCACAPTLGPKIKETLRLLVRPAQPSDRYIRQFSLARPSAR